ncbi:hypothetical protein [Maridesulfovibrio sp.]|uniref:hypothetical protein n=1 Tax=Maridesulfovibrio sp. TaxID=2795000 RepID=UPI0039EFDCCC
MNMTAQNPLKLYIAGLFSNGEALDVKGIHELVCAYYSGEEYCSVSTIDEHLKSLKDIGIIYEEGSHAGDAGELVTVYRITEYGLDKLHNA